MLSNRPSHGVIDWVAGYNCQIAFVTFMLGTSQFEHFHHADCYNLNEFFRTADDHLPNVLLHIDPEPYATLTAYCDPEAKTTQSRWPRSSPPNKWFLWDGFGRQFYLWNHHLWWISDRQLQLRLVKLFNHNVSKMLEFLWQQKGICLHFLYKLHL